MRWIHKTCRKQMRWREKFFWWKICENELGDNIPHTLCIPQPPPFYNFLGGSWTFLWGDDELSGKVWLNFLEAFGKEFFPDDSDRLTD